MYLYFRKGVSQKACMCIWRSGIYNYKDADGYQLNYLQAFRLKYGYSSGPWDYWKGPDTQGLWDENLKRYRYRDE